MVGAAILFAIVIAGSVTGYARFKTRLAAAPDPMIVMSSDVEYSLPVGTTATILDISKNDWRYRRRAEWIGKEITLIEPGCWQVTGFKCFSIFGHFQIKLH